MEISTMRYNSTYGFVNINGLEEQAEKCFGKGWEAESDVEQIRELIDFIGVKDLTVSFIEGLEEDDILVSENDVKEADYKENHEKLREILQKYGNEEFGDCIVDEISFLFGHPTTIDLED